jgi:hypothetical protein
MSEVSNKLSKEASQEDVVVDIPIEERTEEEEERVTYYLATYKERLEEIGMREFPINKIKHKRVEIPVFKDDRQKRLWEEEEIKRCIKGYKGMTGKMYFFFNYTWMINLKKGKFTPEYRVCDNEWFRLLNETKQEGGWGIVCVKRRRVGASWKEAADALHDALFTPFSVIGMNSKTQTDSRLLFEKVMFVFENLPQFLRIKVGSKTKDSIEFYRLTNDDLGNKIKRGHQSYIVVKAPTVSAFEGHMLNKWICDEAGKQVELPQMWNFTEDTMMQETERVGMPVLFGTSGEIGKAGAGLKAMWDNAESHRLHKFFFAGYMGIGVDEFGNDKIEECIRWIVYERKRYAKISSKSFSDFLQRYPLTISEAFNQSSEGGLGDIVKINAQKDALEANPPKATRGRFKPNRNKEITFVPETFGEVVIYEHAKKGMKDLYVAGCDPADHDKDDRSKLSDLSLYIMRKMHGTQPPTIVAQYTARPKQLNEYYQQAIYMLQYYNDCKVLIESNRSRMISYFDETGFKYLLHHTPQGIVKLTGGRATSIGMTMTENRKDYLADLCVEYIDEYCEWIPDVDLLKEFPKYKADNTDRIIGFGLALILLKEDKTEARRATAQNPHIPSTRMVRDSKGNLVRQRG